MTDWSVLLTDPPALTATEGGTGLTATMRIFANLSLKFSRHDVSTVEFDLPMDHYQTGLIVRYVSDVLLYRDDEAIQRMRCTAKTDNNQGGVGVVHFTFSSYKAVVDWWLFHDTDHLDYPASLTGSIDPVTAAWNILSEGQSKASGDIQMTQGLVAGSLTAVKLYPSTVATPATHYFAAGANRGSEIESKIANLTGGFEWDIEPAVAHPQTKLEFNTWPLNARTNYPGANSPLVLNEGSMQSWSRQDSAGKYCNVLRVTGGENTTPVYVPASGNPTGTPTQGRWEVSIDQSQITDQTQLAAYASQQFALMQANQDAWTVVLAPGRDVDGVQTPYWGGKAQCWLGDNVRLVLTVDLFDDDGVLQPTPYLQLDRVLQVWEINIAVDATTGSETVTLVLNPPPNTFIDMLFALASRVSQLERLT